MPISPSERVAALIREMVETGRIRPGERLPAERDLAADQQINHSTVARAVAQLRKDGYLESRRGLGTYVRSRPIPHRVINARPVAADRSHVSTATEPANDRVATFLSVATGTEVHIERWTESIDDQRIALATAYSINPADITRTDGDTGTELVRARLPSPEEMVTLGIADITPVLIVTRVSTRQNGPQTVVDRVFAADRVELAYREP